MVDISYRVALTSSISLNFLHLHINNLIRKIKPGSDQQELPGPDVKGEKEVEDHNTMGMLQLLHFKRGRGI